MDRWKELTDGQVEITCLTTILCVSAPKCLEADSLPRGLARPQRTAAALLNAEKRWCDEFWIRAGHAMMYHKEKRDLGPKMLDGVENSGDIKRRSAEGSFERAFSLENGTWESLIFLKKHQRTGTSFLDNTSCMTWHACVYPPSPLRCQERKESRCQTGPLSCPALRWCRQKTRCTCWLCVISLSRHFNILRCQGNSPRRLVLLLRRTRRCHKWRETTTRTQVSTPPPRTAESSHTSVYSPPRTAERAPSKLLQRVAASVAEKIEKIWRKNKIPRKIDNDQPGVVSSLGGDYNTCWGGQAEKPSVK